MRILQVLSSKVLGGIEQVNLDYCDLLRGRGHDVILCMHPAAATLGRARESGATVLADPVVSGGFALINPLKLARYRSLIWRDGIDAIVMHNGKARPLFRFAALGLCPIIGVCHNHNFKQRLLMDAALCVNSTMLDAFRSAASDEGLPSRPSFYIPNPLSLDAPPTASRRGRGTGPVVIGALCRMTRKKGLHVLLPAARRMRDRGVRFRLVLGGEGSELPALRRMAAELELDDVVTFAGWVEDRESFFNNIDVFCLPSLREPFGLVVTEAMVCGCPVVVSDADGPRDIVDDGVTGLMVKKDAPELLADALSRMVEDPGLAARLAVAGQVSVRERFGAERVGKQLETAIGAVVAHYRKAQTLQRRTA